MIERSGPRLAGILGLTAAVLVGGVARGAPADALAGLWNTPEAGGSVVRLAPCGEGLCGWVVSSARLRGRPDQRDVLNKDASQRGRPVRNLQIMRLRTLSPTRWGEGWLYDPNDGGTYHGTMEGKADGTLRLTGCIAFPLCRTQVWTRVGPASSGAGTRASP